MLSTVAAAIGAPEAGLRLLASVMAAYPLGWALHGSRAAGERVRLKLVALAACGLAIGLFNFGASALHGVVAVLFSCASTRALGATALNVRVNFAFHMGYLLCGYCATGTDTYDIKWTMPHCVLALRLIGLAFDLADGARVARGERASKSVAQTALASPPTPLETLAYVFFPASYLVGPQFSMVRFMRYARGEFAAESKPSCLEAGARRAALGALYLVAYQLGTLYFPDEYFLSPQFDDAGFFRKHLALAVWGKVALSKYIACWLLTEGACITYGLAYDGVDEATGESKWDGCRNVRTGIYERSTKFGHYIESFNTNTNAWVAQYVYKRAAFLGNRQISQALTLLFLALWHGFHSGYYMSFFLEFAIMMMEKELQDMIDKSGVLANLSKNTLFNVVSFVFLKLYVTVFMGYCLVPFTFLSFSKWWSVYKSLYFSGFVLFLPWTFLYKPLLRSILAPKKTEALKQQ